MCVCECICIKCYAHYMCAIGNLCTVCVCMCMFVCVCVCVCVSVCMCVCVCVCVCTERVYACAVVCIHVDAWGVGFE